MSRNRQDRLRRVTILGGGPVAGIAALGFARALPGTRVDWIMRPVDPEALADRLPATLPSSAPHLEQLGLDEAMLVARAGATHRLGERFLGWGPADYITSEGQAMPLGVAGALHHHHALAPRHPLHSYRPAAVLADAGRFVHPTAPDGPLGFHDYGLRLDPDAITPFLADRATRAGVSITSGEAVDADLIVDATGPAATPDWIDWTDALPATTLTLGTVAGTAPDPCDTYRATDDGWQATWPLANRTLTGTAVLGAGPIRPGRRREPWQGNILALGDAAAAMGPLCCTGFALALANLSLALSLLPGRDLPPLLLAEYNRRAGLRADRLADLLSAHHHLAGHAPARPGLAHTLAQFARRGFLPHFEEESVGPERWLAVLAPAIRPQRPDPIALSAVPPAPLDRLHATLAALPARLPSYPDYLARMRHA